MDMNKEICRASGCEVVCLENCIFDGKVSCVKYNAIQSLLTAAREQGVIEGTKNERARVLGLMPPRKIPVGAFGKYHQYNSALTDWKERIEG